MALIVTSKLTTHLHRWAICRDYNDPMIKGFPQESALRRTGMIVGTATLLSFLMTGGLYLSVFGIDYRFWDAMTLSIVVTVIVGGPISWKLSLQRERFRRLAERLKKTQSKLRTVNRELQHKANYDSMTGLPNREKFFDHLDKARTEQDTSVLMIIDVDHFKTINDTYGHLIGDQALILMAKVLRRILRKNDLVGRIGGEEFGIFLPDTCDAEGQIIGEMIRHEIEAMPFEPHKGMRHAMTVSIGLTSASPHHDRASLLTSADTALFEAKRRGRNRVIMFEQGMRSKPRPFYEAMKDVSDVKMASIMR